MKIFVFFTVFFFAVSEPLWANIQNQTQAQAQATAANDHCIQNPTDPFDPHLQLSSGPNQGKCLDTSLNRSVVLLKPDPYSSAKNPRTIRIANFTHKNQQWIAEFDPIGIESILFQIVHFPSQFPTAHIQLRIQFRRSSVVTLFRQSAQNEKENLFIQDIVISVQAIYPKNRKKWDPVFAVKNHYGLAYRILSTEQRVKELFADQHQLPHIEQILLGLNETQKTNILLYAILLSDQDRMNHFYYTMDRNSITETFSILDHALVYSPLHQNWIDANRVFLSTINPIEAAWALWIRGLYQEKLNDFEKEYLNF